MNKLEENKHILLVCNYFAPENTIAAVRISKLAKYFKANGYKVSVVTEKKENIAIDETLIKDAEDVDITYIDNSKFFKKINNIYQHIMKPHKEKRMNNLENRERVNPKTGHKEFYPFETAYPIIGSLDYLVSQLRQLDLSRNVETSVINKKYDIIITSYGDSFSFFLGKKYKRLHSEIPWIFDIRDAIFRYKFTPTYVKWIPLTYEKYIWKNTDVIVGVSKGICRRVPKKYRYKVFNITNGFDRENFDGITTKKQTDKMTFTYTGSMYGGLVNFSEFFRAIHELDNKINIDLDIFDIRFAGNLSAYEIFKSQARKYGVDKCCCYVGKLSRKDSIMLQRQSDILLMASYDYKQNNIGSLSGKLFEYMAAERPVISIITGDVVDSEVTQLISKTNIGISCEYSKGRDDFEKLKNYICLQYNSFINKKTMIYNPVECEVNKYKYENITRKYIKLIEKMERKEHL